MANSKESRNAVEIKERIIQMVKEIEDVKFLNQIRIILKRHMEKEGD